MRLDLFLKTSRLVPRRSLAQELCDAGLVKVNDAPAKSSKEIKEGDLIEVTRRNNVTKVMIIGVPETKQVSKTAAADLYRMLEQTDVENDPLS